MKYAIRIIKKCQVRIENQVRSFEGDEELKLEEEQTRSLIHQGLALPGGVQQGKPVRI